MIKTCPISLPRKQICSDAPAHYHFLICTRPVTPSKRKCSQTVYMQEFSDSDRVKNSHWKGRNHISHSRPQTLYGLCNCHWIESALVQTIFCPFRCAISLYTLIHLPLPMHHRKRLKIILCIIENMIFFNQEIVLIVIAYYIALLVALSYADIFMKHQMCMRWPLFPQAAVLVVWICIVETINT